MKKKSVPKPAVADEPAPAPDVPLKSKSSKSSKNKRKEPETTVADVHVDKKIRSDTQKKQEVNSNWKKLQELISGKVESADGKVRDRREALPGELWPPKDYSGISKEVALDCEMVGVGPDGSGSILARVGMTDRSGLPIMDLYVKPTEKVTDYRFAITGITAEMLQNAPTFQEVQNLVGAITKGRIIVGHDLSHDLKVLLLDHPRRMTRDTARFRPLMNKGRPRSLRHLTKELLSMEIQSGSHSPVEDAKCTMMIYCKMRKEWEKDITTKNKLFRAYTHPSEKKNNNRK